MEIILSGGIYNNKMDMAIHDKSKDFHDTI